MTKSKTVTKTAEQKLADVLDGFHAAIVVPEAEDVASLGSEAWGNLDRDATVWRVPTHGGIDAGDESRHTYGHTEISGHSVVGVWSWHIVKKSKLDTDDEVRYRPMFAGFRAMPEDEAIDFLIELKRSNAAASQEERRTGGPTMSQDRAAELEAKYFG